MRKTTCRSGIVGKVVALGCLSVLLAAGAVGQSGRIVVNHDEWTLSNQGFSLAAGTTTFVQNVTRWFAGNGVQGRFLSRSSNFGIASTSLAAAVTGAGHGWVVDTTTPLSLGFLLGYTGVFVAGTQVSNPLLVQYVQAGGCVYLAGGTGGLGGSAGEANAWSAFLNAFGFAYAPTYNGISGVIALTPGHPIFAGVPALYYNNGNTVLAGPSANPLAQILQGGKFGVFESAPAWQVNQPASSLDANGLQGWQFLPAPAAPATGTVHLASTNLGLPWDLAVTSPQPGLPAGAGGLVLADGQIVNVDLLAPSLFFLNGATFTAPFPGPLSLPYALPPLAPALRAQMVVADPSHASGLALSQLASIVP